MKQLFDTLSKRTSRMVTRTYSTSFSLGIRFLAKRFHDPVYAVYGFVRLADEIVDSFHDYDKRTLFSQFREDTYRALDKRISLNPVLNAFQETAHRFRIGRELIDTFLRSMEMDLDDQFYDQPLYEKYILGSAEVVGLMCLMVFTEGDQRLYEELKPNAMKLGSAFQKINFLRDIKADTTQLGRTYFPQLRNREFTEEAKKEIEKEILEDFRLGYEGIKRLPKQARFGVYVAYIYYSSLLDKIMRMPPQQIMSERVRIPDNEKYALFCSSYFRHSFNLL